MEILRLGTRTNCIISTHRAAPRASRRGEEGGREKGGGRRGEGGREGGVHVGGKGEGRGRRKGGERREGR